MLSKHSGTYGLFITYSVAHATHHLQTFNNKMMLGCMQSFSWVDVQIYEIPVLKILAICHIQEKTLTICK